MSQQSSPTSCSSGGHDVFILGPGRSGTALLYKLLCLHPDVAYVSNLERSLPWLPLAVSGRVRLRRYSAKLRYWFRELPAGGAPMHRLIPLPVEGEALCHGDSRLRGLAAEHAVEARDLVRMRRRFADLRAAARSRVVASKLGPARRKLPLIDAVFPQARYISVVRDGHDVAASLARLDGWSERPLWWDPQRRSPAQAVAEGEDLLRLCARNWRIESEEISRGLARIPHSRVFEVRFEDLVATPVEQMRAVTAFLGLERRMDYEWALKTLKLDRPASGGRCAVADHGRLEELFREQESPCGFAPAGPEVAS